MKILEINNLYNGAGAENIMKSIWNWFSNDWNEVYYITTQKNNVPNHIQVSSIQQTLFWLLSKWKMNNAPEIKNPIDSLWKRISLKLKKYIPLSNFLINRRFENIVNEIQPDIIHIHNLQPYGVGILKIFKKYNIPTYITLHWYWPICPSSLLYTAYSKEICNEKNWDNCSRNCGTLNISNVMKKQKEIIEENVTQLVAVSEFVKNRLIDFWYNPMKITTIHNGIDVNIFHPTNNPKRDYILHVWRLSTIKWSLLVLEVAKKLPQIKFTFIGSATPNIRISDNVNFIEWIEPTELVQFYQNAKAVIAPSLWPEPHSLVPLEVMACWTPIILSRIGWNPESIKSEIYPELLIDNIDDIINIILKLTDICNIEDISEKLREDVLQRFSKINMYSKYKQLFFKQS
jgi:glycosyltransferase involved in cell wall biosynthesis